MVEKMFLIKCKIDIEEIMTLFLQQKKELHLLQQIQLEVKNMSQALEALKIQMDNLIAEVARNTSVDQSAVVAIQGLADQQAILSTQLAEAIAANDPVAIQAASDGIAAQVAIMSASADALASAIPVATPAA